MEKVQDPRDDIKHEKGKYPNSWCVLWLKNDIFVIEKNLSSRHFRINKLGYNCYCKKMVIVAEGQAYFLSSFEKCFE